MTTDYLDVTEVAGEAVSQEQIQRMLTRYAFARRFCGEKDVLEVACGSGQGLGILRSGARSLVAGDCSSPLLLGVRRHYGGRVPLVRLDGQALPFRAERFDVVVLYEAIYYLASPEAFVSECARVLRRGGRLLLCNPNKDRPDFNPSPHSFRYFSPADFAAFLLPRGFAVECYADCPVDDSGAKQRLLTWGKRSMVRLGLLPKTMAGKKLLRRLVFGKLFPLPEELALGAGPCPSPLRVECTRADRRHKVIFAVATKD